MIEELLNLKLGFYSLLLSLLSLKNTEQPWILKKKHINYILENNQ